MSSLKVLLTGGTGYIGGSVLSTLVASEKPPLQDIGLSVLVRGEDRAKVFTKHGFNIELFRDLDETELLEDIASNYDIVIQCVLGSHSASAVALIRGLGRRLRNTGKQTFYIHTSGTSNLSDLPMSGKYRHHPSHVFSDKENIYAYEKYRESQHSYIQRANDLAVVETGLATGVRTTILMPPTVYGIGSGLFNRVSVQIPVLFRTALQRGQAIRIGDNHTIWNNVHIEDLVSLYEIVLTRIAEAKHVPYGEEGILFSDGGEFAWSDVYTGVAKALKKREKLKTEEMDILTLKEAAEIFTRGDEYMVEVGFAANGRTRADIGREWGWNPQKLHDDFLSTFDAEVESVLADERDVNYTSHLSRDSWKA